MRKIWCNSGTLCYIKSTCLIYPFEPKKYVGEKKSIKSYSEVYVYPKRNVAEGKYESTTKRRLHFIAQAMTSEFLHSFSL